MLRYILEVNKWTVFFFFACVSIAIAQEPIPPPSLPHNERGWIDMLVKMSPFLLGVIAPYGNDLKSVMPKLFGKVPVPLMMLLSSILSMFASAMTAYVSGLALENQGGVTPEVAVTETGTTSLLAHKIAQKEPTNAKKDQPPS